MDGLLLEASIQFGTVQVAHEYVSTWTYMYIYNIYISSTRGKGGVRSAGSVSWFGGLVWTGLASLTGSLVGWILHSADK